MNLGRVRLASRGVYVVGGRNSLSKRRWARRRSRREVVQSFFMSISLGARVGRGSEVIPLFVTPEANRQGRLVQQSLAPDAPVHHHFRDCSGRASSFTDHAFCKVTSTHLVEAE